MFLQLRMAAGYLAVFVMPGLLALGLWLERPYLAFGAVFLVFPLARSVFGAYQQRTPIMWREGIATCLDRLPLAYGFVLLCVVAFTVWMIGNGTADSPAKAIGIGLSLWLTMRINQRTATIGTGTADGGTWRVPFHMLRHLLDI